MVERRLGLKVNGEESEVVPASVMTMLGFGFSFVRGGKVRVRVGPKAVRRLKVRIRELASRRWSIAVDERIVKVIRFTAGWVGCFQFADTPRVFSDLDGWFRRGMRQIRWKEWERPRARRSSLLKLGISERFSSKWGYGGKGYWRIAGSAVLQRALPNSYGNDQGLHMLKPTWQRLGSAR